MMSKQKVGETVQDGNITWTTTYNDSADQFEYRWSDGQGNSGSYTDRADLNWPFGSGSKWGS